VDHRWFKRSTGKKRPVTRDIHVFYYNNNNNNNNKDGIQHTKAKVGRVPKEKMEKTK